MSSSKRLREFMMQDLAAEVVHIGELKLSWTL